MGTSLDTEGRGGAQIGCLSGTPLFATHARQFSEEANNKWSISAQAGS